MREGTQDLPASLNPFGHRRSFENQEQPRTKTAPARILNPPRALESMYGWIKQPIIEKDGKVQLKSHVCVILLILWRRGSGHRLLTHTAATKNNNKKLEIPDTTVVQLNSISKKYLLPTKQEPSFVRCCVGLCATTVECLPCFPEIHSNRRVPAVTVSWLIVDGSMKKETDRITKTPRQAAAASYEMRGRTYLSWNSTLQESRS